MCSLTSSPEVSLGLLVITVWRALTSVLVIFGCSSMLGAAEPLPNILLIVSDDQRPDTISALGSPHLRTPAFDRLVQRGSAFTRCISPNPICTPARAELLTGCTGFRNGVLNFGGPVNPELPTLPRLLERLGYQRYYVGKWHNDGKPVTRGYTATRGLFCGGGGKYATPQQDWAGREVTGYRGWIFQDDDGTLHPEQGVGLTAEISSKFADAAIEVLQESDQRQAPCFLHVNFTAPHDPLLIPPQMQPLVRPQALQLPGNFLASHPFDHGNFAGRDELLFRQPRTPEETLAELAVYYAVIMDLDQQVGRILDAVDQLDTERETLIVFTSDHGLAVGSHGLRGKQNMYEHTVGVPLLLAGPGVPQGKQFAAQCTLRDILPTVLELAAGPQWQQQMSQREAQPQNAAIAVDGRSLVPVLQGKQTEVHPFVTGYFHDFQRMIRAGNWKYVEYPAVEQQQLFDLEQDPLEMNNLAGTSDHAEQKSKLRLQMYDWFAARGDAVLQR